MNFGGSELLVIAVIFFPIAAISGAVEGRRCGYRGYTLTKSCFRSLACGILTTSLAAFAIITLFAALTALRSGDRKEIPSLLAAALIATPVLGLVTSLLPAPVAAFLAYNFGARKRVEEEIAAQSLAQSPAPNPIEPPPSTLPNPERGAGN